MSSSVPPSSSYHLSTGPFSFNPFSQPITYPLATNFQIPFGNFPTNNADLGQSSQGRAKQVGSSSKLPKAKLAFPEFDELNPRSWLRHYDKFFDLYQVSDEEKMTYVSIHLKDYVDNWFDSYVLDRGGKVTWAQFCFDLCQRFDNTQPVQIVAAFNRLEQTTDVDTYKRKFEEFKIFVNLN